MTPQRERRPWAAVNPARGMTSSEGMGGRTFSRNIRMNTPTWPMRSIREGIQESMAEWWRSGGERGTCETSRRGMSGPAALRVACGIGEAGFGEASFSQEAGVAVAAGEAIRGGIVAAVGKGIVHAELGSAADDLGFGKVDE